MDRGRKSGGDADEDSGDGQTGSSLTLTATFNVGSLRRDAAGCEHPVHDDRRYTLLLPAEFVDYERFAPGMPRVTLTLPIGTGKVTVTAEGPWPLGHPVATFTETSN